MDMKLIKKSPNVIESNLDDKLILLNLNTECYHSLSGIAYDFWILMTDYNPNGAMSFLLKKYEVSEEVLRNDILELIDDMIARGLLVLSQP